MGDSWASQRLSATFVDPAETHGPDASDAGGELLVDQGGISNVVNQHLTVACPPGPR